MELLEKTLESRYADGLKNRLLTLESAIKKNFMGSTAMSAVRCLQLWYGVRINACTVGEL